jgi:hypothetical protein
MFQVFENVPNVQQLIVLKIRNFEPFITPVNATYFGLKKRLMHPTLNQSAKLIPDVQMDAQWSVKYEFITVAPTSQIRASTSLLLLITGKRNVWL